MDWRMTAQPHAGWDRVPVILAPTSEGGSLMKP
jgi:hypothetical protein